MEQLSTANNLSVAGEDSRGPVETFQYVVISVGAEQYGIDIRYVDNIVRMQAVTRVPKVPDYLKGVINLRGEVIPVMSIRLKMGLENDEITRATRIIILKLEQEGNVGVMVDEVKEVVTLNSNEIDKVSHGPKDGRPSFINGIGKHNNSLISLLDLNSITLGDNV
ncbi:MAG: chemotaxis protein CheW [Lachnospiraceae bacterium]|nr:chemotaxis protein CheW [Lachnospiraceae bacterium]